MVAAAAKSPALTPDDVIAAYEALSPIPRIECPLAAHQIMVYVSNGAIGYWAGWTGFDDYRECFDAAAAMEQVGIRVRCPVSTAARARYL